VFVGLNVAQQMLKIRKDVSEVAVMTPDRKRLEAVVASLRAAAPARTSPRGPRCSRWWC